MAGDAAAGAVKFGARRVVGTDWWVIVRQEGPVERVAVHGRNGHLAMLAAVALADGRTDEHRLMLQFTPFREALREIETEMAVREHAA